VSGARRHRAIELSFGVRRYASINSSETDDRRALLRLAQPVQKIEWRLVRRHSITFIFAGRPAMTTLTITDLPCVETMHRNAMSAIHGGMLYLTNPDSKKLPEMPKLPDSWPGAALLKELHLPPPLPALPSAPPPLDPRLL
jgi:hypothetical protein